MFSKVIIPNMSDISYISGIFNDIRYLEVKFIQEYQTSYMHVRHLNID